MNETPNAMERLLLLLALLVTLSSSAVAQTADTSWVPVLEDGPVYVVPVEGMIDNGLARYLGRALGDAAENEAAAVILHIDTFGGLVDAADQIRKDILDAPMPVVAFIDKNAASAGALISYAADRILMAPGASMGAATVVEGGTGEAAPDKYQSYMRGLMRSTAEANGRDPAIAEAMVDESLEVPGISPAGSVLTLSAEEAVELGVADAVVSNLNAVTATLNVADARLVSHRASRAEKLLRFFGSPVVQSILMLMMLGGLYFELQTPGVGFAGAMALIGASLFFGPNYLLGLAESWEVIVFVIGIVLLLVEIFVLPGFGVAGISGLVLIVGSLAVALIPNIGFAFPSLASMNSAIWTLAITLVVFVALSVMLGSLLPKTSRFSRLILAPEMTREQGFTSADTHSEWIGQLGRSITPLRPSGAIMIASERIDATTAGEFVERDRPVKVVRVRGSRVEVREIEVEGQGETLTS